MKYTRFDPYQMKNHRIIWSCNFEPTNAKESAKYSCTPIKGMLTINDDLKTEQSDNPTHDRFYTFPRYFVPFKKTAKGCDLEDLAWSKAVNIRARVYADTEAECLEAYNDCIMQNIKHMIILLQKNMHVTSLVMSQNLTKHILKNSAICKQKGETHL